MARLHERQGAGDGARYAVACDSDAESRQAKGSRRLLRLAPQTGGRGIALRQLTSLPTAPRAFRVVARPKIVCPAAIGTVRGFAITETELWRCPAPLSRPPEFSHPAPQQSHRAARAGSRQQSGS